MGTAGFFELQLLKAIRQERARYANILWAELSGSTSAAMTELRRS